MISAYSSEHALTDASEVWKMFFEAYLILDIETTIRLQKPHCKNFWLKRI